MAPRLGHRNVPALVPFSELEHPKHKKRKPTNVEADLRVIDQTARKARKLRKKTEPKRTAPTHFHTVNMEKPNADRYLRNKATYSMDTSAMTATQLRRHKRKVRDILVNPSCKRAGHEKRTTAVYVSDSEVAIARIQDFIAFKRFVNPGPVKSIDLPREMDIIETFVDAALRPSQYDVKWLPLRPTAENAIAMAREIYVQSHRLRYPGKYALEIAPSTGKFYSVNFALNPSGQLQGPEYSSDVAGDGASLNDVAYDDSTRHLPRLGDVPPVRNPYIKRSGLVITFKLRQMRRPFILTSGIGKARQVHPSSLHHGNAFSSDISGDGHAAKLSCKFCDALFPSKKNLLRHRDICSKQPSGECNACGKKFERISDVYKHVLEVHPKKGDKGKGKVNRGSDNAAKIEESLCATAEKTISLEDTVVDLKEEVAELRDVPAGLHSAESPIVNAPKAEEKPKYDEFGITTEPGYLATLELGDEIHITPIPTAEAVSVMWSNWWNSTATTARTMLFETACGVYEFCSGLPEMVEDSLDLVARPIVALDDPNVGDGLSDSDVFGVTVVLTALSVDVFTADESLDLLVRRSTLIDNYEYDMASWVVVEKLYSLDIPAVDVLGLPAATIPLPRANWAGFWGGLAANSHRSDLVGVCAATTLFVCVTVQESILRGLLSSTVNAKNRTPSNFFRSNNHFSVAGNCFDDLCCALNPKNLWDMHVISCSIIKAEVIGSVDLLGMDSNEMPLLARQQKPMVHSKILDISSFVRIEAIPDPMYCFNQIGGVWTREFALVPNSPFWKVAGSRVVPVPGTAVMRFKSLTIKPALLQELNLVNTIVTEETGRNFRNQINAALRGAASDPGLGIRLREDRSILADTVTMFGQVVERSWSSTVFTIAPLCLN